MTAEDHIRSQIPFSKSYASTSVPEESQIGARVRELSVTMAKERAYKLLLASVEC